MSRKYKLVVFVPDAEVERVKAALFAAGAGRLGNYDECSWQSRGLGQFRPKTGSTPYIGVQNQLEKLEEWRLETLVQEEFLQEVVAALREAHPYEEPAFDLMLLANPIPD